MTARLAVLSDIHGNARALEAVLGDIARRGISDMINLGDCAYGPFNPAPVLDQLIALRIPTVSGNEDQILVALGEHEAPSTTARFVSRYLVKQHVEWLRALPLRMERENWIAFHARPDARSGYLLISLIADGGVRPATQEEVVDQLALATQPLILCGHDHLPRVLTLEDKRVVVNPGSVGCPAFDDDVPIPHRVENGTPHARYAVVETQDERIRAELIRVPYDWVSASKEAKINGFPDWAQWLATGCC